MRRVLIAAALAAQSITAVALAGPALAADSCQVQTDPFVISGTADKASTVYVRVEGFGGATYQSTVNGGVWAVDGTAPGPGSYTVDVSAAKSFQKIIASCWFTISGGGSVATPTITKTGSGSSKTSGTSLAVTVSTTSYATGDYLVVGFAMDPQTGTVSFAKTAGTATIGAFSTAGDVANGSGTSGVRSVMAYAKVTAAGTITTVTVTHPTATARAAEVFNVTGADGTTPVPSKATSTSAGIAPTLSPLPTTGVSYAGLGFGGAEVPSGTSTLATSFSYDNNSAGGGQASFTSASADATSVGTSGGGSASNISVGYNASTVDPLPSSVSPSGSVYGGPAFTAASASTQANISALFAAPAAPTNTPVPRVYRNTWPAVNMAANY